MKDVSGYGGAYQISRGGKVWSKKSKIFLKHQTGSPGYPHVTLCRSGKPKTIRIHRLLAEHFLPNPLQLPEVNHVNGNKLDFSLSNLEWCDYRHNAQHAYDTGLNRELYKFRGVNSYSAKLNPDKVREIKSLISSREMSLRAIGRKFGVSGNTIIQIRERSIWASVE